MQSPVERLMEAFELLLITREKHKRAKLGERKRASPKSSITGNVPSKTGTDISIVDFTEAPYVNQATEKSNPNLMALPREIRSRILQYVLGTVENRVINLGWGGIDPEERWRRYPLQW